MASKKNLILNFMIFFILFLPLITVQTQANKNLTPVYSYPAFNVKDNIMFIENERDPEFIRVGNTTDLTDYSVVNDCPYILYYLNGSDVIYPYCYGNHLFIPTVSPSGNLLIEVIKNIDVYNPEYLSCCELEDSTAFYTGPEYFDEHQKLILQENILFFPIREVSGHPAIQIINATDYTNLTCITRYKHGLNEIFDYAIYENTMFLTIDDTENIRMVNITDKYNPVDFVNNYSIPYTFHCSLEIKDDLLFAYDDSTIQVYNVSDIPNLDLLYTIETIELDNIVRIVFYNDYLISIHNRQISIYDLTTPSNTTTSEFTFEYEGLHSFYFGLVDNNRLYTSMFSEYEQYTLAIYDLTDITDPELLYPYKMTTPIPIANSTLLSSIVLTSAIIYYWKKRKQ